jgi:hypothetical protein
MFLLFLYGPPYKYFFKVCRILKPLKIVLFYFILKCILFSIPAPHTHRTNANLVTLYVAMHDFACLYLSLSSICTFPPRLIFIKPEIQCEPNSLALKFMIPLSG